ncbi:MAG: group 1 truncated hemoglobin [Pseudomonadota bacterium]
MSEPHPTLFEELGGEPVLRRIIDRFIDRVFDDPMIGYMFQRASRKRIKDMEFEFAARHLGAPIEYTGRPLEAAHRAHTIFEGHFNRRLTLLRETLEEENVPERVREHWIAHTLEQKPLLVRGPCNE